MSAKTFVIAEAPFPGLPPLRFHCEPRRIHIASGHVKCIE
jgi:hypothetical protein